MAYEKMILTLWVSDMTCVSCENKIELELSKRQGVEKVNASYSSGMVTVICDGTKISIDEIEQIIRELGYSVSRERKNEKADTVAKTPKKMDITDLMAVVIILFAIYRLADYFGFLGILNAFPVAKEGMGYGMLFLIGMLTSVHCVAMCGGICLSQCAPKKSGSGAPGEGISESENRESRWNTIRPSLLYNLGRVVSYTVIGGMIGALGSVISFTGSMKGIVQLLAGAFMVIMGLNMLNIFPWLRRFNPRMPKVFAKKIYARKKSSSPFYIGLLNGLMPCGPLQAMQLYALSTGSPLKGAFSMFLFSIGTVPLMFAFGVLSSFLNKKFTGNMMKVSAALVILLGVFMFHSGIALSGLSLPQLPGISNQSGTGTARIAEIGDGVQIVTTDLESGRYEPIIVQKGIPVKWIIRAEDRNINGCNNSIVVPKYDLQKDLAPGQNIITFTPKESGTIPFSCWMGMIRGRITVVDDLNNIESNVTDETAKEEDIPPEASDGFDDYSGFFSCH